MTSPNRPTILEALRDRAEWSVSQLASRASVPERTIVAHERDGAPLPPRALFHLAMASPATAEGEEPAAERCARWIAQVLAGPPYHLLDADRARAFLFAESLTRKGPQAWRYFGPTEEHTIRLALTPRGYIAAAVSACINHIIEATWSGIIHDREGASWLALDEWITSHPLCPREYLGRRRDLPPPRLRYGVDPNVHFVESWLARRAQLTVTAELYMLAKVVDGARDRANDAQSISRIRGHRADSVVLDEALWRTW